MVAWPSEHLNNSGLILRAIAFSLLVCGVLRQMTKLYLSCCYCLLSISISPFSVSLVTLPAQIFTRLSEILSKIQQGSLLQISPPDWLDLDFLGSLNSFSVSSPSSLMQHHPQFVDSDLSKPCVEQTKAVLGLKRVAETVEE